MRRVYVCEACGAQRVRLWRKYQTSANNTVLRCRACSEKDQGKELRPGCDQIGWLIPAVPSARVDEKMRIPRGETFWGYTSVPQAEVEWWLSLPEVAGIAKDKFSKEGV